MFRTRSAIVNQWRRLQLTGARGLSRLLAATLFPPDCCLCGFPGASPDLDLCHYCHGDLPWDGAELGALTALRFEHPVDDMIRRLKYRGDFAIGRVLGALLAEVAAQPGATLPKLLVPVPLHDGRLRERGFNQAAALARFAGRLLEIPVAAHALRRVRDTPSQTALSVAARGLNVRDAFAVDEKHAARLTELEHVAIVDDVMTTGSTLRAARAALLAAGVSRVELWAVARALPSVRDTPGTAP
jgi:ComF family protein